MARSDLQTHIIAQMTALVNGKTTANMPMYTTLVQGGSYVRDPSCWAPPFPSMVFTQNGGLTYRGMVITEEHVIFPKHAFGANCPTPVDIVDTDNSVTSRSIDATTFVGSTDMMLGRFSVPVPTRLVPKITPENILRFFSISQDSPTVAALGFPVFVSEVDNKAHIVKITKLATESTGVAPPSPFDVFYLSAANGSSGNPGVTRIENAWVDVFCGLHTPPGSGAVPSLSYKALLAAIQVVSPGSLALPKFADLSNFIIYGDDTQELGLADPTTNDGWTAVQSGAVEAAVRTSGGITATATGGAQLNIAFPLTAVKIPAGYTLTKFQLTTNVDMQDLSGVDFEIDTSFDVLDAGDNSIATWGYGTANPGDHIFQGDVQVDMALGPVLWNRVLTDLKFQINIAGTNAKTIVSNTKLFAVYRRDDTPEIMNRPGVKVKAAANGRMVSIDGGAYTLVPGPFKAISHGLRRRL